MRTENKEVNKGAQLMLAIPEFMLGTTGILESMVIGKFLVINKEPEDQLMGRIIGANKDLPFPTPDTLLLPLNALGVSLPISLAVLGLTSALVVSDAFRRLSKIRARK